MSIELLYLFPILALSILIFAIVFRTQRKGEPEERGRPPDTLTREVKAFNDGVVGAPPKPREVPQTRLSEIEKTISLVSKTLSSQQKIIEEFQGSNAHYTDAVTNLKNRLKELQREYDIVLSENYSLRAKLKRLRSGRNGAHEVRENFHVEKQESVSSSRADRRNEQSLFEDTRVLHDLTRDGDTREINVEDLAAG